MTSDARRWGVVIGLWMAGLASLIGPSVAQQPADFSFGVFGDLGYSAAQEPLLENVLADLDRAPLAFVVHVGDLGSPDTGSCTDALRDKRLSQFRAAAHPLIYTPGDNDWTDCHGPRVAGFDPLERLTTLRAQFFVGETSFGRRTVALIRQAKYRENARWDYRGITFLTLHVVGSNNGAGFSAAGDTELTERDRANSEWLQAGFAHAKANGSRAIMIFQQANFYPELPPFPGDPKQVSGFKPVRGKLEAETLAFAKPVVLAHGDSHFFRVDKPFRRPQNGPVVENFTRLETFGAPHHHWVQVSVDADDPNVFVFRQRIVPANVGKPQ